MVQIWLRETKVKNGVKVSQRLVGGLFKEVQENLEPESLGLASNVVIKGAKGMHIN